jgi:hypothetical protein
MRLLEFGLHVLVGFAGGLILWSELFLYEPEEGRVQSILDEWWVRIDDLHKKALSKQRAFITELARQLTAILDWVFGRRLFSVRSVGASVCMVFASQGLFNIRLGAENLPPGTGTSVIEAVIFMAIALVGVFGSRKPTVLWLTLLIDFVWSGSVALSDDFLFEISPEAWARGVAGAFRDWIIGTALNLSLVAIARYSLRPTPGLRPPRPSSRRLGLATLLYSCFLLIPVPVFWSPEKVLKLLPHPSFPEFLESGFSLLQTIVIINITILLLAVPSIALLGLSLVLIIHRLFWPALSRPIYALARFGILKQKKIMVAVGLMLCFLSISPLGSWGSAIADIWEIIREYLAA